MKTPGIHQIKRVVYDFAASKNAVVKIEFTLPSDAQTVTGVFFSLATEGTYQGVVSIRFSEGASNCLLHQHVRHSHSRRRKKIKFIPLCEPIVQGCLVQGMYSDQSSIIGSYILKIYIEYIPR